MFSTWSCRVCVLFTPPWNFLSELKTDVNKNSVTFILFLLINVLNRYNPFEKSPNHDK